MKSRRFEIGQTVKPIKLPVVSRASGEYQGRIRITRRQDLTISRVDGDSYIAFYGKQGLYVPEDFVMAR